MGGEGKRESKTDGRRGWEVMVGGEMEGRRG